MVVLAQPLIDDGLSLPGGSEPFGIQDLPAQGRIADPRRPARSRHISTSRQLNLNLPQYPQTLLVRIPLPSHAKPSHWHNDSGSVLGGKDNVLRRSLRLRCAKENLAYQSARSLLHRVSGNSDIRGLWPRKRERTRCLVRANILGSEPRARLQELRLIHPFHLPPILCRPDLYQKEQPRADEIVPPVLLFFHCGSGRWHHKRPGAPRR